MQPAGSLVCVGIGMTLGAHLTPLARDHIQNADVVFTGLSDGIIEMWIARMNGDVRSLQSLYREGKPRMQTYREMVDTILTEVRAGKRVCAAFYGHPSRCRADPAGGAGDQKSLHGISDPPDRLEIDGPHCGLGIVGP